MYTHGSLWVDFKPWCWTRIVIAARGWTDGGNRQSTIDQSPVSPLPKVQQYHRCQKPPIRPNSQRRGLCCGNNLVRRSDLTESVLSNDPRKADWKFDFGSLLHVQSQLSAVGNNRRQTTVGILFNRSARSLGAILSGELNSRSSANSECGKESCARCATA